MKANREKIKFSYDKNTKIMNIIEIIDSSKKSVGIAPVKTQLKSEIEEIKNNIKNIISKWESVIKAKD